MKGDAMSGLDIDRLRRQYRAVQSEFAALDKVPPPLPALAPRKKRKTAKREPRPCGRSHAVLMDRMLELSGRRAARDLLTLTGCLMGDPPPGYSALDRPAEQSGDFI